MTFLPIKKMNRTRILISTALLFFALPVFATDVPSQLPDPDGESGDAASPVKVYILAGQSNMVGMGDVSGARNMYSGLYLSSDPAVPDSPMAIYRVGTFKTSTLSVYLPNGTPTGTPIAEGFLEVPQSGVYRFQCGYQESSYNVMHVDGMVVYHREEGHGPIKTDVTLAAGQRYAFQITGFQGDRPRFWLEKTDLQGRGDLETVVRREGMFPWLVDDDGNWTVRNDVYFQEARLA